MINPDRSEGDETAHFELSFSPNVSLVSTVRRFVTEFYVQILADAAATSQLAVATHELLDNAVLYSFDGNTTVRIGVKKDAEMVSVTIATRNRASPDNLASVRTRLDELSAAEDPNVYYQKMMRETAKRLDGSGLGLARVRAESDMKIAYEIQGDCISLRAIASFPIRVSK
jgi:anti-sigma regulatory factor (Ser/Thr protein kinase)